VTGPASFSVTKHILGGGVVRLALEAEIDMSCIEALAAVILQVLTIDRAAALIIDLDAVTFLDATGITALIDGRRRAAELGATYRISNPQGLVRRVLDVTGTLDILSGGPA